MAFSSMIGLISRKGTAGCANCIYSNWISGKAYAGSPNILGDCGVSSSVVGNVSDVSILSFPCSKIRFLFANNEHYYDAAPWMCQFGRNRKKMGTFTHPFSTLCSNFHHKDGLFFLLLPKTIRNHSSLVNIGDGNICLFNKMVRMLPQPSVAEFNKLLSSAANEKRYSDVFWMFRELRQLGGAFVNDTTMNIAIHCYCSLDHLVDSGFAILGCFFKSGSEPGPETFNNLLNGLFSRGEGSVYDVIGILSELIFRGFIGRSKTAEYSSLIFRRVEPDISLDEAASELFYNCDSNVNENDDMVLVLLGKNFNLVPCGSDSSYICDSVIDGYCKLGHIDKAKQVFDYLVEIGHYKPSIFSYNSLIIGYCKQGNVNEALQIFLQISPSNGVEHTRLTYNTMIYGLFCEGRFEDGWKIFKEMEASGQIHPDSYTYKILMYGLCRNRKFVEAFSFIRKMEEDEGIVNPDLETYEILINELCKDGKPHVAKRDVFNQLPSKGLWPTYRTYNMIISSLFREGFTDEAKYLFKEMVEIGWKIGPLRYMFEKPDLSLMKKFCEEMRMRRVKRFLPDDDKKKTSDIIDVSCTATR